jgi:hypothetical protein
MYKLEVMNPVAELQGAGIQSDVAPRSPDLTGKKVGLIWNRKSGGDAVLERVGSELRDRYPNLTTKLYAGGIPTPQAILDQASEECDVFVGSSSD